MTVTQKHYADALTSVDYLSHPAVRLLDVHAALVRAKKGNMEGSSDLVYQIDSARKQLYEVSCALVLEYRKRRENERFLKEILISISDQLFSLNNSFKETSRLLFQEIRLLQSQMQYLYEGKEEQHSLKENDCSHSPSRIDEIIKRLQKAREKLSSESPHLFEK